MLRCGDGGVITTSWIGMGGGKNSVENLPWNIVLFIARYNNEVGLIHPKDCSISCPVSSDNQRFSIKVATSEEKIP